MTGPNQNFTPEPMPNLVVVPTLTQCRAHKLNRIPLLKIKEKGAKTSAENRAESPLKQGHSQKF